tara:strand:+ start:401 stop:1462 length:1062 start_codon:yes stop_codon:yes gene_type:complete
MAIDVLTYNALQEVNEKLKEELQTLTDDIATASGGGGGGGSANADAITIVDSSSMLQANQWCRIPTAPETGSFTQGFKVCDTSGYFRCGCNCTWTVPGGTTCVRFQIWGAGGGTTESRCCMHTMPGTTGAYASVIMPTTSGSTFTMCAGCAYCCYAGSDGYNQQRGETSYITGPGLTNFCAEGGWSGCMYKQVCDRNDMYFPSKCSGCCCMWINGCMCRSGATICSGDYETPGFGHPDGWYDGVMPWLSCSVRAYGSATGGEVWTIRGQDSSVHADVNYPMRMWSATVYGYDNACCGRGGCFVCNNCGGHCQSAWTVGARQIPGVGGWGTSSCGGDCTCGDSGRMGMVCVSYN